MEEYIIQYYDPPTKQWKEYNPSKSSLVEAEKAAYLLWRTKEKQINVRVITVDLVLSWSKMPSIKEEEERR